MSSVSPGRQALPLEGVRVLELSHIVAGPSGGLIPGDLGADSSITDIGAATYGIIAALYRRERTGEGDCIQAGLYETIVFWVSQYITTVQLTGENPQPRGGRTSTMGTYMGWGVYQLFPTRGVGEGPYAVLR